MRLKRLVIVGLSAFFLSSAQGWAQPPGQSDPRNGSNPPSNFGGRGGRGGGGGGNFDPNQLFNQWTNGKDVWNRADLQDPQQQRRFDMMAQRMGITNGQITRQQFLTYQEQRQAMRNSGGGGPGGPGGNGPGGFRGGRGGNTPEAIFLSLDKNGDGYLNYDEMPPELRAEREKWDTDRNWLIDLTEFKAFYQAQTQGPGNDSRNTSSALNMALSLNLSWESSSAAEEERKPPTVYRAGKLPKELPSWFAQLDTDQDGQIGLYEWKASGKSIQEFDDMDRNKDGFLTVDEVLHFTNKTNALASNQQGPGMPPGNPGFGGGFGGGYGGGYGFDNGGFGRGRGGPPGGGRGRGGPRGDRGGRGGPGGFGGRGPRPYSNYGGEGEW